MREAIIMIAIFISLNSLLNAQENYKTYNGVINDNIVGIRAEPFLDSSIIGYLNKGDSVKIYGRSFNRMYLNGNDSYWLRIQINKIEGWAYGAYINLTDFQYDSLPILSENDFIQQINLNYSRNLPLSDLMEMEKEMLTLQSNQFVITNIKDFYNSFVNLFNNNQSLRPFFPNTNEIGYTERSVFFYLSSSLLCDYIQTSYIDGIKISPLNIHNDDSAAFLIYGFRKNPVFTNVNITGLVINIKKIKDNNFKPFNNKVIIDWIILTPDILESSVPGSNEIHEYLTSMPILFRKSNILYMILD